MVPRSMRRETRGLRDVFDGDLQMGIRSHHPYGSHW
jgi:hypothetical protein